MERSDRSRDHSARCLQLTILTASRTKESTRCRWPDIDLAARIRGVEILKGGQAWQHVVPLSDQTMILLRSLLVDGKPNSEWLFPARNRRGSMGQCTVRDLLERMDWLEQTTTHVIRAAFKTWATERTNYPREVAELCLSHVQAMRWNAPTSAATSSRSVAS
jgi:integrase